MENWFTPTQPDQLPAISRALVLAPHPDDEIFGCGGTLALLRQSGCDIQVHILTDGAAYHQAEQRAAISRQRFAESDRALALLNIRPASHGNFQDRDLAAQAGLAQHIAELIDTHRPQLIFAPSLWEIHPDHLALARATCAAIGNHHSGPEAMPTIMFYEIGAPCRCNSLIDITPVWVKKTQAMATFASQLVQQDYLRHITALNEYRTYTLPPETRYAEAFIRIGGQDIQKFGAGESNFFNGMQDRWIETALSAADACCEMLQKRVITQENELTRLEGIYHKQAAELDIVRQERDQTHRQAADTTVALNATLNSTSWRITAPLRRLASLLKP